MSSPPIVTVGGTCAQRDGRCICTSGDACHEQSTRIYSLNDPQLDKCFNELPCPDHPKFSLELAIQDYRDRYRLSVQEEAT